MTQIDKIKEEFIKEFGYIDEDSNWWPSKIEEVKAEAISQHNELLIKKIERLYMNGNNIGNYADGANEMKESIITLIKNSK